MMTAAEIPTGSGRALAELASAVGSALTRAGGSPRDAAPVILDALRGALKASDLVPENLPGPPLATYRQHILHTDPEGRFSIAALVWLPGHRTTVHDHTCWCCFGVWKGRETGTVWGRDESGELRPGRRFVSYPGDVEFLIPPGDIHQVANDDTTPTVSIHVYGVDLAVSGTSIRRHYEVGPASAARDAGAPRVIAVVGGGFSGTMTAVHLLRRGDAGLRVVLFEPVSQIGRGVAYGTVSPRHLLNVPAGGMSALPDTPDHFHAWCVRRGVDAAPGDYLPRRLYGEYMGELLRRTEAESDGRLEIRPARVDRVEREGAGWSVVCEDGVARSCDAVVLAIGTPPDRQRPVFTGTNPPAFPGLIDPWRSRVTETIGPADSVLIIGAGLTSLDVISELEGAGHRSGITVLSRRGLRPFCHNAAKSATPFDAAAFRERIGAEPRAVAALCRCFRAAVDESERAGGDWRDVINAMRPITTALWAALPPEERRRFMRHLKPFWEVARHRVAPATYEAAARLESSGLLHAVAGRILRLENRADGRIGVEWRTREGAVNRREFDHVVNATGFSTRLSESESPLIRHLSERGWMREDEMGLGVETASDYRLVDRDGAVVAGIHYVGPMLRARFWECTAVPELRARASEVADAVLVHDYGRRRFS